MAKYGTTTTNLNKKIIELKGVEIVVLKAKKRITKK